MPRKKTSKSKSVTKTQAAHIPDSIKKQGQAADDLQEEIVKQAKEGESEGTVDSADDKKPITDDKATDKAPAEPVKEPADDGKVEDWKHKYDVLQGKFNSQENALRNEINNLRQLIENQNSVIEAHAEANKRLEAGSSGKTTDTKPPEIGINGVDVDDYAGYGDEIVDLATKFNQLLEANQKMLAVLEGGVSKSADSSRIDRIEQQQRMTAQDRYLEVLDSQVPDWRRINESQAFAKWLNETDPVSMYRRYDILKNAVDELRSEHVVNIFKAFGRDTGQSIGELAKAANQEMHGNTNIVDETSQDPLASQIMPAENVGSTGEGQPQEKLPTKEEFNEAVTLYTKGKITVDDFNEISRGYHRRIAQETS